MHQFQVTSGGLRATDPCYDMETWCAGTVEGVKNGTWQGSAETKLEGRWGLRIAMLQAVWVDPQTGLSGDLTWEKTKIDGGVDSGQFGFFDLSYFIAHEDERDYNGQGFYTECCNTTLPDTNPPMWGVIGNSGIVSSAGYGDGSYNVYVAKNAENEVIGVKVVFIGDEEEEENEEEELDNAEEEE